jgi:hypothetical protein
MTRITLVTLSELEKVIYLPALLVFASDVVSLVESLLVLLLLTFCIPCNFIHDPSNVRNYGKSRDNIKPEKEAQPVNFWVSI